MPAILLHTSSDVYVPTDVTCIVTVACAREMSSPERACVSATNHVALTDSFGRRERLQVCLGDVTSVANAKRS